MITGVIILRLRISFRQVMPSTNLSLIHICFAVQIFQIQFAGPHFQIEPIQNLVLGHRDHDLRPRQIFHAVFKLSLIHI